MSDLESAEARKRLSMLQGEIRKQVANPALRKLIEAGCDPSKLLLCLGLASGRPVCPLYDNWFTKRGPESLNALFGLNGRDFSAVKELLLKSADWIDAMNRRFEFGVLLTTPHLQLFQGLPETLRGYVSLLDLAAQRLGRGTHFYRNFRQALLSLYVKERTGRPHDDEVSELLRAVRNNTYDVTRYREWLTDHRGLLTRLSSFIPVFSSTETRALIKGAFQPKAAV